jgi:hypothetical protein
LQKGKPNPYYNNQKITKDNQKITKDKPNDNDNDNDKDIILINNTKVLQKQSF